MTRDYKRRSTTTLFTALRETPSPYGKDVALDLRLQYRLQVLRGQRVVGAPSTLPRSLHADLGIAAEFSLRDTSGKQKGIDPKTGQAYALRLIWKYTAIMAGQPRRATPQIKAVCLSGLVAGDYP